MISSKSVWVRGKFGTFCLALQILLVVLFAIFVDYDDNVSAYKKYNFMENAAKTSGNKSVKEIARNLDELDLGMIDRVDSMFQDSHTYAVAGFGIIYTFLKKYGYGGLGLNLLLCCLVFQWGVLCQGFFAASDGIIKANIIRILGADGLACTIVITWGVYMGKTNPLQTLLLAFIEVPLAATNEWVTTKMYLARDAGGSMTCHVFATYFGIGAALVLFRRDHNEDEDDKQGSTYYSDIVASIGALILWIYWPSLLAAGLKDDLRHRAVLNTYFAMASSCVTTFAISSLLNKNNKFTMGHIQNASLAGGVAIGSTVDLMIGPYGALLIGIVGAVITVLGMEFTSPFLRDRLHLHDTCGVNNLHGMTGAFGGLVGVIMACKASVELYGPELYELYPALAPKENGTNLWRIQQFVPSVQPGEDRTPLSQAAYQMMALVTAFFLSLIGGVIAGLIIRLPFFDPPNYDEIFDDAPYWKLPHACDEDDSAEDNFFLTNKTDDPDVKEFIKMADKVSRVKMDGENHVSWNTKRNRSKSVPNTAIVLQSDEDNDLLSLVNSNGEKKNRGYNNHAYNNISEA